MFCKKCGTQLPNGMTYCPECQTVLTAVPQPQINSWLIPAILTTVCCCMPFGIVAIIYASKVSSAIAAGDFAGAEAAAKNARLWSLLGIGIGAVSSLIYCAFVFLGALAGEL